MMNAKSGVSAVLLSAVVCLAPLASASEDFGASNDNICLVSQGGVNKICIYGGTPSTMDEPYEVNGGAGLDTIRVKSDSDCSCTCSGAGIGNFVYDDDVDIDGEGDHDSIYGANPGLEAGINLLRGGASYDYIRGGSGSEDHLYGDAGADIMYDPSGANEQFDGGADYDTIRDSNCVYQVALSTCGAQSGSFYTCFEIPDDCEESTTSFSLGCPP